MSQPPAFPLYADDFLSGTADMSNEEVGAYIRLLCHSWSKDGLANDCDRLSRMAGAMPAPSLGHVLSKFIADENGLLRHPRLEKIRADQAGFAARQAEKGRKGAEVRWKNGAGNGASIARPLPEQCPENGLPLPLPLPLSEVKTVASAAPPPIIPPVKSKSFLIEIQEVFDAWNKLEGFPKCLLISDKRRRCLEARLRDQFFVDNWRAGLAKLPTSSFLRGQTEAGAWKASFDWFIKPDSLVRIMEGRYDDNKKLNGGHARPLYVGELKSVLEAQRGKRAEIERRGYEDAFGIQFSKPEDRAEWQGISREIRDTLDKIAKAGQ